MGRIVLGKSLSTIFRNNGYNGTIYYDKNEHLIFSTDKKYIFDTI